MVAKSSVMCIPRFFTRLPCCEEVGPFHDHKILAILLHFGTRPLPEQDAVADLDVGGMQFSGFIAQAGSNSDDFTLGRLLLRGVGDEYAARGHRLLLDTTDQDAVLQRTQPHCWPPRSGKIWGIWHCRIESANIYSLRGT